MDARLKKILETLGVDRPVVKTETLEAGVVRVTLLGGDSFEVTLEGAPAKAGKAQKTARPQGRQRGAA